MNNYHDDALAAYGTVCEWVGCGWNVAECDVHHISYQEQQEIEKTIRNAIKIGDMNLFAQLLVKANDMGYLHYDKKTNQLEKDNRVSNLTVLCPNHHRYTHEQDLGKAILSYIPIRKPST